MDDDTKISDLFRAMADRIDRNRLEEFAGAILIAPPSGEPIAVMLTDPTKDAGAFWALAMGKVQVAASEHQLNKQGINQGFPPRR